MMKNRIKRLISAATSVLLMTTLLFTKVVPVNAANFDSNDPLIVVSLGDSYSSGEGIEPFYGQDKPLKYRVQDHAWLAHRSKIGWPALLEVQGIVGTMSDYNADEDDSGLRNCIWYFRAASGAKTEHFNSVKQIRKYRKILPDSSSGEVHESLVGQDDLPLQLDVFNGIKGTVDYVTLSVGGNDVEFAKIITTCATKSTYLGSNKLEKKFEDLWQNFNTIKTKIKNVYTDICAKAPSADVIVVGYPQLLEPNGKGVAISKKEATLVNTNVSKFNDELEKIVEDCQKEDKKVHFVDVEGEFSGHQAYSSDAWINKIYLGHKSQELDDCSVASDYSVHPNEEGAKAYARCVNAKIAEIENDKSNKGYIKGKICKASDRSTPISGATVTVYDKDNKVVGTATADETGNYTVWAHSGEVRVDINAPGYIGFSAYTEVFTGSETYMETFLMVEGDENETGIAEGVINNALTGSGVEGVNLTVRRGWGNSSIGDVVTTATTDSNGNYSISLPLGNYTVVAEKEGYISGTVNIIVQSGTTGLQNGTITPILSGDNYRIVLTWGANPSDLDSHVVGTLTSGDTFHVYYSHTSQYDGSVEVCNLDVDDTSSYGPETITLNATTDKPYYYYIYRYAGSGTVASSEAQINVYQGSNLVATFNVPTDQGSGDYWNVFAVVNGELIINNTITSSADVSYANSGSHPVTANLQDEGLDVESKEN